jgi:hypothetical protein
LYSHYEELHDFSVYQISDYEINANWSDVGRVSVKYGKCETLYTGNLTYTNWEIQVYGMYNVETDSKMESLRNLSWIKLDPDRDQL